MALSRSSGGNVSSSCEYVFEKCISELHQPVKTHKRVPDVCAGYRLCNDGPKRLLMSVKNDSSHHLGRSCTGTLAVPPSIVRVAAPGSWTPKTQLFNVRHN
jgi:hypothetical protein